jgi:hypothetical protein
MPEQIGGRSGQTPSAVLETDRESALVGKVAQILNARELVINIGANHGVLRGMRFRVMARPGQEILDPDTGASLGRLEREKLRVEVVDVMPLMAIGKTYETRRVATDMARVQELVRDVAERIPVAEDSGWVNVSDEDTLVRVGDRIVQIEDGD